jgi:hypothetical protein
MAVSAGVITLNFRPDESVRIVGIAQIRLCERGGGKSGTQRDSEKDGLA